jgi:hypothetical protein
MKTKSLSLISLNREQQLVISAQTPEQFIKERKGRGNRVFRYVEGGYVVAKLNNVFGPLNWQFTLSDQKETDKEVFVKGTLTIKDHVQGFAISKEQYGQADRNEGVPVGDTYKAASTDALKKCATLFGIALDVYWNQLDGATKKDKQVVEDKKKEMSEMVERSKQLIEDEHDSQLLVEWKTRINKNSAISIKDKKILNDLINAQIQKQTKKS